jgi:hypothetical protein
MCYHCGKLYAKWETKTQDRLKQFAENIDSPFYSSKNIVGLDNKKKTTDIQKQRQKQKERIEQEPDPDIKRELKKGLHVDIIEDSMNY